MNEFLTTSFWHTDAVGGRPHHQPQGEVEARDWRPPDFAKPLPVVIATGANARAGVQDLPRGEASTLPSEPEVASTQNGDISMNFLEYASSAGRAFAITRGVGLA